MAGYATSSTAASDNHLDVELDDAGEDSTPLRARKDKPQAIDAARERRVESDDDGIGDSDYDAMDGSEEEEDLSERARPEYLAARNVALLRRVAELEKQAERQNELLLEAQETVAENNQVSQTHLLATGT